MNIHRLAATAVTSVVASLCLLSHPAHADQATASCDGRTATLVGTTGQAMLGTPGADVIVTNGATRVDAGAGDDLVCVTGTTATVTGGTGVNTLTISSPTTPAAPEEWVVDDVSGTATRDGHPALGFSGFTHFAFAMADAHTTFHGSARSESVMLAAPGSTLTAYLGAGKDHILVTPGAVEAEGGPGRDTVDVQGDPAASYVHLDLARGTVKFDPDVDSQRVSGFENAEVDAGAATVRAVGSNDRNRIAVTTAACTGTVLGRGGADTLSIVATHHCATASKPGFVIGGNAGNDLLVGTRYADFLAGGRGDDTMRGGAGRDELLGGDGADKANGGEGVNYCYAETEYACN